MKRVLAYIEEARLNLSINLLAFFLMRLTGIALAAFLVLHLWTIGHVQRGFESFDGEMRAYDSLFGQTIEYLLLLAVLYHMFNGLRIVIADFLHMTRRQSELLWLSGVLVLVVASASFFVFFPGLRAR